MGEQTFRSDAKKNCIVCYGAVSQSAEQSHLGMQDGSRNIFIDTAATQ